VFFVLALAPALLGPCPAVMLVALAWRDGDLGRRRESDLEAGSRAR
jgi:hypothetical protein